MPDESAQHDLVALRRGGARAPEWTICSALVGGNGLRPFEVEDAAEVFTVIERNQSELAAWLAWAQQPTERDTLAHIEQTRAGEVERRCVNRAIVAEGRIVGSAGLGRIDWANGCAEIGYWLDGAHRGRGLVTAAVAVLVRHAFDGLSLNRAEIRTDVLNGASRAVAERLGFRFEGTLREAYRVTAGRYSDDAVYALLASDLAGGWSYEKTSSPARVPSVDAPPHEPRRNLVNANRKIRPAVRADAPQVERIAIGSGLFEPGETGGLVAALAGYLDGGLTDHAWVVCEHGDRGAVGAAYYAPEPFSAGMWNLYFIAVLPDEQSAGAGSALVDHVERALRAIGQDAARTLIVETSSLDSFASTRDFYRRRGYDEEATIRDFYGPGDNKVVFWKSLHRKG